MPTLPPKLRLTLPALAIAISACFMSQARAEIMPHSSIEGMCMTAELIVIGQHEDKDQLRIREVLWQQPDERWAEDLKFEPGQDIKVWSLSTHNRKPFEFGGLRENQVEKRGENQGEIQTKDLVLFANIARDGNPTPIFNFKDSSQGVVWFDDDACHHYSQIINPGGYFLVKSSENSDNFPHGAAALKVKIKQGLKQRAIWEDMKAIEHADQRARAIARFYVKATTPNGNFEGADMAGELKQIGADAVVPIAEAMDKLAPDESIRSICSVLNDMAREIPEVERAKVFQPTVDPLLKWMAARDKASPYEALLTLEHAADPRAIEAVRPFLKGEDESNRFRAIRALGAMKDEASFDHMAELILASPDTGATGYNMSLMGALISIDLERAMPVLEKFFQKPGNEGLRIHLPQNIPQDDQ